MTPVKLIGGGIIVLLAGVFFLMSYFTVDQNEMTVVTRFGHIEYVADPGCISKCRSSIQQQPIVLTFSRSRLATSG